MKAILYCNFSEIKNKLQIQVFLPEDSKIIESKWLKIFYYLFLKNKIIDKLSLDITNNKLQYLTDNIKIEKNKANKILTYNKFYFEDNLEQLTSTLLNRGKITSIDEKYFKIYLSNNTYYVQQFTESGRLSRKDSAIVLSCILKTLIDEKQIKENDEIIYICHDKHIASPKTGDYLFSDNERNDFVNEVISTLDGYVIDRVKVNIKEIISFQHEPSSEVLKNINKDVLSINCEDLIEKLKGQKEKDELNKLKKKIINLWLPLAIDIQGLSEVQTDTIKAEKYFEAINAEKNYLALLESFPNNKEGKNDDFPRWEEIKKELKDGYDKFDYKNFINQLTKKDFKSLVNQSYLKVEKDETEDIKKIKSEVDNTKSNNGIDEFEKKKKELKEKMKNPNFLPNWLQEVVRVIEKKLEG